MNTHETFEEQPVASTAEHWTDRIARQNRQDTLALAKQYRLRVKYEDEKERKDLFIPGRRGQLYFDDGKLCLTMLNAPVREGRPGGGRREAVDRRQISECICSAVHQVR